MRSTGIFVKSGAASSLWLELQSITLTQILYQQVALWGHLFLRSKNPSSRLKVSGALTHLESSRVNVASLR